MLFPSLAFRLTKLVRDKSRGVQDIDTGMRAQCPPLIHATKAAVAEKKALEEKIKAEKDAAEKERLRQEHALKVERQMQLRARGVCCMGFEWLENSTHPNYRCAGGGHTAKL